MRTAMFLLAAVSSTAAAFPDNVKLGYPSCSSCHLSPNGGGVTKDYGRSAGEENATLAPEGSGRLLGLVQEIPGVLVGGDARWATVSYAEDTTSEEVNYEMEHNLRSFPMQVEGELALNPDGGVWVVATLGHYGEGLDRQLRRNYVLWTFNEESQAVSGSMRAGHFVPAFGINTPDHTAATRSGIGLGEGSERLVAEARVAAPFGELTISETFSGSADGHADGKHGYSLYGGDPGWAARIAWHAIGSTFGASAWRRPTDDLAGLWAVVPLSRTLVLMAEWDRSTARETKESFDVAWSELGWEAVRGFTLLGTAEYEDGPRYGAGARWIPVPHLELIARGKWSEGLWSVLGMTHVWL